MNLDGMTPENRVFFEALGEKGVQRIGEIAFDYIKVCEEGDTREMKAFRDRANVIKEFGDIGRKAQAYLDDRLDDVEKLYGPEQETTMRR